MSERRPTPSPIKPAAVVLVDRRRIAGAVELRYHLAASPEAPARARQLIGQLLRGSDGQRERAVLAVSELVTNALRHGQAVDQRQPIELRLLQDDDCLRASVLDPGSGIDSSRRRAREPGGWGLALVHEVTRAWGHGREDGRTLVWFEI